jgi:hypothetical protein
MIDYPAMLDSPAPRLRAYPREAVVAEKFHAMVIRGLANSRMKDFFDLWMLSSTFEFAGPRLSEAISATFERRNTPLPNTSPLALTEEFYNDPGKKLQWDAFLRKGRLNKQENDLARVVSLVERFLMPPTMTLVAGQQFRGKWQAEGPWR